MKKNVRGLRAWGLALVAMLLFSGSAVASAPAAKPEFKSPSGFPVKFSVTSGATKLATVSGRETNCKSDTASGEVTSSKTMSNIVIAFQNCTTVSLGITFNCGTITTNKLTAEPNYLTSPDSASEVGLDLKPASGTAIATATCTSFLGNETMSLSGSVVGKITPTNTLTKTFTLAFVTASGKQKYEGYFVGSTFTKDVLEKMGSGLQTFGPEQAALEATQTITTATAIELSA